MAQSVEAVQRAEYETKFLEEEEEKQPVDLRRESLNFQRQGLPTEGGAQSAEDVVTLGTYDLVGSLTELREDTNRRVKVEGSTIAGTPDNPHLKDSWLNKVHR